MNIPYCFDGNSTNDLIPAPYPHPHSSHWKEIEVSRRAQQGPAQMPTGPTMLWAPLSAQLDPESLHKGCSQKGPSQGGKHSSSSSQMSMTARCSIPVTCLVTRLWTWMKLRSQWPATGRGLASQRCLGCWQEERKSDIDLICAPNKYSMIHFLHCIIYRYYLFMILKYISFYWL